MNKTNFVCIHGHFYQPPRENPFNGITEKEESAFPYHDWNTRIASECYSANANAKILDENGKISQTVNNYANISFNFGSTLLQWLEKNDHSTYQAILEADRFSVENYGHGNAIAQSYHHSILPLNATRDAQTEIIWGIRDFKHRFQRLPEGFWLPETAVDRKTLTLLAQEGIRFAILAPHQAKKVRSIGQKTWNNLSCDEIDFSQAYEINLGLGQKMALFFYNGDLARSIAFNGILHSGDELAQKIKSLLDHSKKHAQLLHSATDGESYGHHHKFGEMALSSALKNLKNTKGLELTNYGRFLKYHPPAQEVEINEQTSWSCVHGVERWKNDCGCKTGGDPSWNQAWRAPLRNAISNLRNDLTSHFEHEGQRIFLDPWAARNDYVDILNNSSEETLETFFSRWQTSPLTNASREKALSLLQIQKHMLAMHTSCGWFFDDVAGIETKIILRHSARALKILEDTFQTAFKEQFLRFLSQAKSNNPQNGDAGTIFEQIWQQETKPMVAIS